MKMGSIGIRIAGLLSIWTLIRTSYQTCKNQFQVFNTPYYKYLELPMTIMVA